MKTDAPALANARPDGLDGWAVPVPGEGGWFGPRQRVLYIGRPGVGFGEKRIPLREIEHVYWLKTNESARFTVSTARGELNLVFALTRPGAWNSPNSTMAPVQLDAMVELIEHAIETFSRPGDDGDVPHDMRALLD